MPQLYEWLHIERSPHRSLFRGKQSLDFFRGVIAGEEEGEAKKIEPLFLFCLYQALATTPTLSKHGGCRRKGLVSMPSLFDPFPSFPKSRYG
jgi:hypothetical protein